ncbi:hypothetical protein BVC93_20960 [Mycobacterium sp. MS1601]|uniref:DUF937 domain-containing protein n=1 Tax=Mycobacterium sp. MS1601 TaxID=1936029 RepID=UPI00097918BD|nr:DUF937 domain-containing protein [Mycobacterium sp. MS1601]AQA04487.1 hypothetical protein BVC93_20960 [Mycobacterium sp. MS1601]
MAGLDDLYRQIPVDDIAARLGADRGEVDTAIRALVPTLVGGLAHNAGADDATATTIEAAAHDHAAAGLLDGGVSVDDVDLADGDKIVGKIFAGRDSDAVASALAPAGVGSSGLIKQLLPILAPIVLAYLGKQFGQQSSGGGGIGDILGSILGGGSAPRGQSDNPLGSILGGMLGAGSGKDNPIGDILGGLLGGKR